MPEYRDVPALPLLRAQVLPCVLRVRNAQELLLLRDEPKLPLLPAVLPVRGVRNEAVQLQRALRGCRVLRLFSALRGSLFSGERNAVFSAALPVKKAEPGMPTGHCLRKGLRPPYDASLQTCDSRTHTLLHSLR